MIEVHGHRGARALRPENTLPGLAYAIELGVDAIEFDVTLAADGLIVAHDLVVGETTILDTGPVVDGDPLFPYVGKRWSELTLAQIATLDAGDRRPREPYAGTFIPVPGTPVPTLDQVCSLAVGSGVLLAVELKTDRKWPDSDVRKLTDSALHVLAARRVTAQSRILAFDWRVLRMAAASLPDVPRVALIERWDKGPAGCVAAARDVGAAWLSPADKMTDEALIVAAHHEGLKVSVWTVNDPLRAAELTALGADAIVTDRPDLLVPPASHPLPPAPHPPPAFGY
jgi:glycerophosphoryl diester phosphodiesterase